MSKVLKTISGNWQVEACRDQDKRTVTVCGGVDVESVSSLAVMNLENSLNEHQVWEVPTAGTRPVYLPHPLFFNLLFFEKAKKRLHIH